jgi:hypothetical protein
VTAGDIIRSAFLPSNQQLRFIFIDCLWRLLWGIVSISVTLFLGAGVLAQLGSMESQGPNLGTSNPIIVLAALQEFWNSYGALLIAGFGFLLLTWAGLWIVLEALFRGGWRGLWIYMGTGVARTALVLGTASIFLMLSLGDESGGTLAIGAVVVAGMWFMVGVLETVVRRNAVDLLATSLLPLSAVMGWLRLVEGVLAFILLGSAAIALAKTAEIALSGMFAAFVLFFWMIVHSYLVAVRYSAIDIMRRDVVGS